MMPSDSYRLYQVERMRSAAEVRRADEQAGRLAAAIARLLRGITRPARSARPTPRPDPRLARPTRPTPGPGPRMERALVPHAVERAGRRAG